MLKSSNTYHVLSETFSFDNIQQIGELITLKALRGFLAFSRQSFEKLYIAYVKDLNRLNYPAHTFSDTYDLAQTAICFLCDFIGKELNDVYTIKNGKVITIKQATYALVCRHLLFRNPILTTKDLLAVFISAKVCFQLHRNNFSVFFVGVNSCHVFPSFAEDVKSSFFC